MASENENEKRGPGRPRLSAEPLPKRSIRASDDEWNNWSAAAELAGANLSAWARDRLNTAAAAELGGRKRRRRRS